MRDNAPGRSRHRAPPGSPRTAWRHHKNVSVTCSSFRTNLFFSHDFRIITPKMLTNPQENRIKTPLTIDLSIPPASAGRCGRAAGSRQAGGCHCGAARPRRGGSARGARGAGSRRPVEGLRDGQRSIVSGVLTLFFGGFGRITVVRIADLCEQRGFAQRKL